MTYANLKRAIIVAVIVGSILNLINSYDVFWYGNFTGRNIIRIVLTYITPFAVSLYSSVQALKLTKPDSYASKGFEPPG